MEETWEQPRGVGSWEYAKPVRRSVAQSRKPGGGADGNKVGMKSVCHIFLTCWERFTSIFMCIFKSFNFIII